MSQITLDDIFTALVQILARQLADKEGGMPSESRAIEVIESRRDPVRKFVSEMRGSH